MEAAKKDSWSLEPEEGEAQTVLIKLVSNLTHLFVTVQAIVRNFAILAPGSSFYHGSQTKLGQTTDIKLNDLFAYVLYQAAVKSLKAPTAEESTILHELSHEPRSMTAIQTTDAIMDTYIKQPVTEWEESLQKLDIAPLRIGTRL